VTVVPPPFIPGLALSRRFYDEAVRPILDRAFPALPHAAGRLGWGSEVLGFDDETSTDHNWGPIVELFVRTRDADRIEAISAALAEELPEEFAGFPVRFARADIAEPVRHWVDVQTVSSFVRGCLGCDLAYEPDAVDWLSFPSQRLRALTGGAVHHDGTGELTALRDRLAFYPDDVWRYLLAATWRRIGQEEHLLPRAGQVGDELGSTVIGSRLVRDTIRLAFLLERQYAPYAKWLGTALARLDCAPTLMPPLWRAQRAPSWPERQTALGEALAELVRRQNALGITRALPVGASPFHRRPFTIIHGSEIAAALVETIVDPEVARIVRRGLLGSIDQVSDNTDLLENPRLRAAVCRLYRDD